MTCTVDIQKEGDTRVHIYFTSARASVQVFCQVGINRQWPPPSPYSGIERTRTKYSVRRQTAGVMVFYYYETQDDKCFTYNDVYMVVKIWRRRRTNPMYSSEEKTPVKEESGSRGTDEHVALEKS